MPSDAPEPPATLDAAAPRSAADRSVIAIDAMGGDYGPETVIAGVAAAATEDPSVDFRLHGDGARLEALLMAHPTLTGRAEITPCDSVVAMDALPIAALREGRGSSMWRAIDTLARGDAVATLSAGNTGALMTMATVRLRRAPGVARPAIAALWPSQTPAGFNVVLDVGADLTADADALVDYAVMGAEYARLALGLERPRVALLNVGSEAMKGRPEVREAARRLAIAASRGDMDFEPVGFIEGDAISADTADVIVTDGFSGNVALKTAEGTARLIGGFAREAFFGDWLRRVAAFPALGALRRLKRRMDPRHVNGGLFLGLRGVVVKSHGAADAVGVASAVALAARMGRRGIAARIEAQVAKFDGADDDPLAYEGSNASAGQG